MGLYWIRVVFIREKEIGYPNTGKQERSYGIEINRAVTAARKARDPETVAAKEDSEETRRWNSS